MRIIEIKTGLDNAKTKLGRSFLLAEARNPRTYEVIKHTPFYQNMLRELRNEAAVFLNQPLGILPYSAFKLFEETGSRKEYEAVYFERRARLNDFAILALIDEDPLYIKALEDTIWAICDEYTWCLPAHLHDPGAQHNNNELLEVKTHGILKQKRRPPEKMLDLFATESGFALAEILNLLEAKLAPDVVYRGRSEVFRRVIEPYQELNPMLWWETTPMNWAAVCAGSIGAAAIYLIDDSDVLAPIVHRVTETLECFIAGFGEDGACTEGISYWTYGFGFYIYFAALLRERTNGKIDLLKQEKVASIARFQHQCYLSENYVVTFSDADLTQNYQPGLTCFLKRHFPEIEIPDSQYQAKFTEDSGRRWAHAIRDLVWTNPKVEHGLEKQMAVCLSDAQWFISKREYDSKAVCFAAKGGHNDEPHNHNDLGSFIFHVGGDTFLADLGRTEYTRQYFGAERYQFLTTSSRGHSVPVIDGAYQKNGSEFRAEILNVKPRDGFDHFYLELAQAYAIPNLKSLLRYFDFNKSNLPKLILTDHFHFESVPKTVTERFITYYPPELVSPGRLRLTGSRSNLDLVFASEQFQLQVIREKMTTPDSNVKDVYLIDLEMTVLQAEMTAKVSFEIME